MNKSIEQLKKQKRIFRNYMKHLSVAEKINHLTNLQWQYYELLEIREKNGGRPIPEKWQRWRNAQAI
jgi:hypothetical protein